MALPFLATSSSNPHAESRMTRSRFGVRAISWAVFFLGGLPVCTVAQAAGAIQHQIDDAATGAGKFLPTRYRLGRS